MIDLIEKKKRGLEHDEAEINFIIEGMMKGIIPDYQVSSWLMAIYFNCWNSNWTFKQLCMERGWCGFSIYWW